MLCKILISKPVVSGSRQLLVLPYGTESRIPEHLQELGWRHMAVAQATDALLGQSAPIVILDIAARGYALVPVSGE